MGQEVSRAIEAADDLALVGALARRPAANLQVGHDRALPVHADLDVLLRETRPDVLVDFTLAHATPAIARVALSHGVATVIGTSGVGAALAEELGDLAAMAGTAVAVVPNFALGAVLLRRFAATCGRYFDAAEIIELHHAAKVDAPSATSLATAEAMSAGRPEGFVGDRTTSWNLPGTRGGSLDGIPIHSVRLPGLLAHQEVLFGGAGQVLTLRHDVTSREAYIPGVLLAVRRVRELRGLVYGLEPFLDLG
jgi:4-hydroxy-tetrahydrodipicolinate reductase